MDTLTTSVDWEVARDTLTNPTNADLAFPWTEVPGFEDYLAHHGDALVPQTRC